MWVVCEVSLGSVVVWGWGWLGVGPGFDEVFFTDRDGVSPVDPGDVAPVLGRCVFVGVPGAGRDSR